MRKYEGSTEKYQEMKNEYMKLISSVNFNIILLNFIYEFLYNWFIIIFYVII